MKKLNYLLVLFLLFSSAANAMPDVSIKADKSKETIELIVPNATPNKVFTVPAPDRLVVDVPAVPALVAAVKNVKLPSSYKGKRIKAMRAGVFDPKTLRFVFDLAQPVRIIDTKSKPKGTNVRIIITIGPPDAGMEAVPAAKPQEDKKEEKPLATEHRKDAPEKREKPLIVIDPGHGGIDPGTIGPSATHEKDIVLSYAKALKTKLGKSGRYRVLLTREDDRFIMLRQRIAIARKAGAALFISLHADSAPERSARGFSVYTLSERASDMEAEALATQENRSDILAGVNLADARDDVADILISLAQRETNNHSALLADLLTISMQGKIRLLPNSHRFAGFAVLKAPDVPSVLVEIGFLSHPEEEKLLKSKAYRETVITGIMAGIDAYFRKRDKEGL